MTRANTLSLVTSLSNSQADVGVNAGSRFYDEAVLELARRGWTSNTSVQQVTAGTASYSPPSTTVDLLAVIWDETQLMLATLQEIEWVDPLWRDQQGSPSSFVVEDEDKKSFRLWPTPDVGSASPPAPPNGLGADFPVNALLLLITESRTDVQPYLDLPLAFAVLAREFRRQAVHRDPNFAEACGQFSQLLLRMVS